MDRQFTLVVRTNDDVCLEREVEGEYALELAREVWNSLCPYLRDGSSSFEPTPMDDGEPPALSIHRGVSVQVGSSISLSVEEVPLPSEEVSKTGMSLSLKAMLPSDKVKRIAARIGRFLASKEIWDIIAGD